MTLTAHRPARSVASLAADDPVELAADLPRLPRGVVLDLNVLQGAACGPEALELCKSAGTAHVAALIGVQVTDLHAALEHWGLEVPNLHQPAELVHDPAKAREAFALVEQVGWVKAAREVGVARRTLRAAFAQWGMGEPVHRGPRAPTRLATDRAAAEEALELAVQVGTSRAAERFGVNPATLYYAWKRWGWNGQPTGPRVPGGRWSGSWRPRGGPIPSGIPGGGAGRFRSRGNPARRAHGQQSGRPDTNAERRPYLSAPSRPL